MEIPEHIRAEYSFSSQWSTVDDHQLHYVDEGAGRAVIMLHGNPTWSFLYRNVIKSLRDQCRCLALDHIGCGLSDKPQDYAYTLKQHISNAVAWIEQLRLESFDLIVHDWGGAIGMGVAQELPNKVGKVVILNTAAFFVDRIPKRISICRIPMLGDLIVRGFNGFAGPATSMAVSKPLSKTVKEGFLLPYNSWSNRVAILRFVQDIPTRESQETFQVLKRIEKFLPNLARHPVLIGWGRKDFCFDDRFLERWQALYPEANVLAYPKSGHYILEDEKNTLIPQIKDFLIE
ncbi:MAG: alpha/beta fold hydrolase [Verrucomicrobia bacterium]|nr:alpha/beta fold hydrolase [Verrucomicrobiota bacterium]